MDGWINLKNLKENNMEKLLKHVRGFGVWNMEEKIVYLHKYNRGLEDKYLPRYCKKMKILIQISMEL